MRLESIRTVASASRGRERRSSGPTEVEGVEQPIEIAFVDLELRKVFRTFWEEHFFAERVLFPKCLRQLVPVYSNSSVPAAKARGDLK